MRADMASSEQIQTWNTRTLSQFMQQFTAALSIGFGNFAELVSNAQLDSFARIRDIFAGHPLFVMMEPLLGCDPQTDHLLPKNVYPIFEEKLRAEQKRSVEETLKKVEEEQKNLVNIINGLISQNFRDIKQTIDFVQRREALCDTVAKVHEDLNRQTLEQYMRLR